MAARKIDISLKSLIVIFSLTLIFIVIDSMRERVVMAGDRAPDFTVVTDNGQTVTRSSFGGKLLVLNFWATWCPPCIEELPSLDAFQLRLRSKGVVVLGISVDKNEQTYKTFLERARVSFLTARDPEANISSSYGTYKYPETYVIDQQGRVVEKFIGPENWLKPEVIQRIERLL
jgi:peroxiredoxin